MLRIRILFWICPSCAKSGILAPERVYVSFKFPAKSFLNHLLLTVDGKYHKAAVHSIKILRKESQSLTMLTFLYPVICHIRVKKLRLNLFLQSYNLPLDTKIAILTTVSKNYCRRCEIFRSRTEKNLISLKLHSISFLKFIVRTSSMLFWHPCRNTVVQRPKNILSKSENFIIL